DLDVQAGKIIVDRVGNSLSTTDKDNIKGLLESKESLKEKKELFRAKYEILANRVIAYAL
ncbi:MAG: hypothetical protein KA768_02840, partial [Desulfobulbus sp.]|nr:hypothetical protein [Desulfobulbus sp.]